jgi:hypothetical protein
VPRLAAHVLGASTSWRADCDARSARRLPNAGGSTRQYEPKQREIEVGEAARTLHGKLRLSLDGGAHVHGAVAAHDHVNVNGLGARYFAQLTVAGPAPVALHFVPALHPLALHAAFSVLKHLRPATKKQSLRSPV